VSQVQREAAAGRFDSVARSLRSLGERFDGCARTGTADGNDLTRDCDTQRLVREAIARALSDAGEVVK
jgi:hypothetical protein